ncbi:MAG: hypothetical protein CVV42_07575 [Candidatus Riflebacteria bacterium HGW-Riflebacteria-2]|jgi:type II secretory pathway component PulJ|nr:MAG: hypothetical protein CVV42_07575 [Candidatus Riflebacteria bacterium HGW-Riflebacteria-2]
MKSLPPNIRGLTLIEIIAGTLIISIVMYMISSFTSNMAFKYKHGFVSLENFRQAHQAVNMLRHDYNMACPYVTAGDGIEELKKFLMTPLAVTSINEKFVGANRRIRISPTQLIFYKYAEIGFSISEQPQVEEVEYRFNPAEKKLIRQCGENIREFRGFREVEFKAFVHAGNPLVPAVWARILLDQDYYKDSEKPLELTVFFNSNFVADAINHNDWQYRTYHQPR